MTDASAVATALHSYGIPIVVITLGSRGALLLLEQPQHRHTYSHEQSDWEPTVGWASVPMIVLPCLFVQNRPHLGPCSGRVIRLLGLLHSLPPQPV
jgi:hypothetical protein